MSSDYYIGYMRALTNILNLLNTYETKLVNKKTLYHKVFEMRPKE